MKWKMILGVISVFVYFQGCGVSRKSLRDGATHCQHKKDCGLGRTCYENRCLRGECLQSNDCPINYFGCLYLYRRCMKDIAHGRSMLWKYPEIPLPKGFVVAKEWGEILMKILPQKKVKKIKTLKRPISEVTFRQGIGLYTSWQDQYRISFVLPLEFNLLIWRIDRLFLGFNQKIVANFAGCCIGVGNPAWLFSSGFTLQYFIREHILFESQTFFSFGMPKFLFFLEEEVGIYSCSCPFYDPSCGVKLKIGISLLNSFAVVGWSAPKIYHHLVVKFGYGISF